MRISEYYELGRSQATLDFVDVDIVGDTRVYLTPSALLLVRSAWADECVSLVQDFFRTVLEAIREGRHNEARDLLSVLGEPNETHLGQSEGVAQGRAVGGKLANDVWEALSTSEAVKSGLLEDLEESVLMVKHVSDDIVSDITTNILRQPLIRYTQHACEYYGIPTEADIDSGPMWDPAAKRWFSDYVELPVASKKKLLLVPKAIVRLKMDYNQDEYFRHYLLERLRAVELSANTSLVHVLKDGRRRVTKKDLEQKYGRGKSTIVEQTRNYPDVLQRYRKDRKHDVKPPLTHERIAESVDAAPPDWDSLLQAVKDITPGTAEATAYEKAIEQLLTALFYPSLTNPSLQHEIHEGRKRIDITYVNCASEGFFHWLALNYTAPHIFVECKNYGKEIGNPELDQLSSRFGKSRGQVGFLVCRSFLKKDLFLKRCRDTAQDGRGFIIPLDDSDLALLIKHLDPSHAKDRHKLLRQRFENLTM